MNIRNGTGPQRCVRCLRDKNEAIQEHLRTNTPCCPQCPLGSVINEALANRGSYTYPKEQDNPSSHEVMEMILGPILWAAIGIPVYYLAYEIWEWEQIWAILTAAFWPLALIFAVYYYIYKLIIGLF